MEMIGRPRSTTSKAGSNRICRGSRSTLNFKDLRPTPTPRPRKPFTRAAAGVHWKRAGGPGSIYPHSHPPGPRFHRQPLARTRSHGSRCSSMANCRARSRAGSRRLHDAAFLEDSAAKRSRSRPRGSLAFPAPPGNHAIPRARSGRGTTIMGTVDRTHAVGMGNAESRGPVVR